MRYVLTAWLMAATAWAAPPALLSYTGTLSDESGAPVADDTYTIEFRLFAEQTGGTALWSDAVDVDTTGGVFSALLGSGTALDLAVLDQAALWLEIDVEGDTLSPRLRVASVPYALQALQAQEAAGLACNGCVQRSHIDIGQVQARVTGSCSLGEAVAAIDDEGVVTCSPTMIFAGSGTAPTAARADHDHVGDFLPIGTTLGCNPSTDKIVAIDALTGDVTCAPDVDTDTLYTQGAGIAIAGSTIGVSFAGFACTGTDKLVGFDALGAPTCLPDVDTDTDTDTQVTLTQVPRNNSLVTADNSGSMGRYTSITIGADGMPVVAYRDAGGGTQDLRVLKCTSPDCSSGTPYTLDGPGNVGEHISIAIGTDGTPVVSYYDLDNTALRVAKCADAACSAVAVTPVPTVDGGGADDMGKFSALAVGTDGLPIVAYRDDTVVTGLTLRVVHCGNAACSAGNTLNIVDGLDAGDYASIAIGADGFPVIAYQDTGNDDLKVAKCLNVTCAPAYTITTLDGALDNVGRYTSITIGFDGFPIISYYDVTNTSLKVAKCVDGACAMPATITPIEGLGLEDIGQFSSITVGADGLPVISYADLTTGVLRFARCGDGACALGNQFLTLDPGPGVGEFTSITIGADGLPVMSYRDTTNSALKVAKCSNPLCLPNWTRR